MLPALITAGATLLGSYLSNQTQSDIGREQGRMSEEQLKYQREKDALDQAYRDKVFIQQNAIQLQTLKQNKEISEQEYQARLAELNQRNVESERNIAIQEKALVQSGAISANELAQRKAEFETSTAQTGEQFGKTLEQRKAEMAQSGAISGRSQTETERINKAREAAYQSAIGRGQDVGEQAEYGFMTEANKVNPELAQMESDLQKGQSKEIATGTSALGAELAKQGVRGGQAATQMRRGIGEMTGAAQEKINALKYQDAQQRAASKQAYLAAIAQQGKGVGMTAPSF